MRWIKCLLNSHMFEVVGTHSGFWATYETLKCQRCGKESIGELL